jgi:predicted alpha-1,2-mannosidase
MRRSLKSWALALSVTAATASTAASASGAVTRHVDPFIGTDGTGHVTPAAMVPFGMVAPGPDNADRGWSYSSGYQYRAPRMLGFSNTHISGAGIPELGDVLMMPAAGARWDAQCHDFSAAPDKKTETARPGFYAVTLPSHGVRVELTTTQRVALHRYTFSRPGRVQVMVDLQHGLLFGDGPRVTRAESHVDMGRGELAGTTHARNWVEREASFVVRFDRPIRQVTELPAREGDKATRYVFDFDLGTERVLHARVALSTVDVDGARHNLAADEGRAFDDVRKDADGQWQRLLSRIEIDADARFKKIFYSALYRTLLHPSDVADADGRVRGPTGEVMAAPGGVYYSTLSLWDTFRGVHPLFTLLVPERVPGFVNSLLAHHRAQGYLPLWTVWGRETHTMIGNPALPLIADAVAKGLHRQAPGFDLEAALTAMVETSTLPRPNAPEWAQRDWSVYEQFGYLPLDRIGNESVSLTLELGIGDDAVARVARAAGRGDVAERFARRAQGWRMLWDSQTKMMRGKDSAGRWREPFDPLVPTSPMNNPGDYTEANAWQYTLTPALHDPAGLVAEMGGAAAFEAWLDRFFVLQAPGQDSQTSKHLGQEGLIGQYAHGNEPSHHIAYLYAWTDAPQKGQSLVRRIARNFYGSGPDGIVGNDDCGQMSAWLVLSTLGFYPVVPASGTYVAGVPLVQRATLARPDGTRLVVRPGRRPGAWLDGRRMDATALPHAALVQGHRLELGPAR